MPNEVEALPKTQTVGKRIVAHFEKHRGRSNGAFFCWITAESLAASALCAALFSLAKIGHSTAPLAATHLNLFFAMVVVAPILETLLLQGLPVALARRLGAGFRGQLLATWMLFAVLHFLNGVANGVSAGVIGGFYFGFAYVHWRERGLGLALRLTCASHAIHNLVAFAGGTLSGEF